MTPPHYDVVVVGAGVAGSIIASELGKKRKRVLILNAGTTVPANRRGYMENFFLASAKTPEPPYPPLERALDNPPVTPTNPALPGAEATPRPTLLSLDNWTNTSLSYLVQPTPDPENAPRNLPFSSTYERAGGGTTLRWLGTSLRLVPHDLTMYSTYGVFGTFADWPITYEELQADYGRAEVEIGVSANVAEQAPLEAAIGLSYARGYQYPLDSIPCTMVDRFVDAGTRGMSIDDDGHSYPIFVSPTPAGRNSQAYQGRPRCAGSTSCIPICPVHAKWDATVSLNHAIGTGYVTVIDQAVVRSVQVDAGGRVSGVEYLPWSTQTGLNPRNPPPAKTAHATVYVLAAHAMENAKLLLNSRTAALPNGVANASDQVGRNLMDHVLYASWALAPEDTRVYPFRGPLTTAGIESLRDGDFRRRRSAFRIEIGNEGWNVPIGDPWITVNDFINGTNNSRLNPITPPGRPLPAASPRYAGAALVQALNAVMTRQFRLTCLVEQSPMSTNRITLHPTLTDGLGIPRPKIDYSFDEYTLNGFRAARRTCSAIYERAGATEFTDFSGRKGQPGYFEMDGMPYKFSGAGHVVGTHRMGSDRTQSVVDSNQQAHDHRNLWIVGSGSFPTAATPNPTLTTAALAFRTSRSILSTLGS